MPDDAANEIMNYYEKRDNRQYQRNFIAKMERKLHNKEKRR